MSKFYRYRFHRAVLPWVGTVCVSLVACSAPDLSVEGLACDERGECSEGFECQQSTFICVTAGQAAGDPEPPLNMPDPPPGVPPGEVPVADCDTDLDGDNTMDCMDDCVDLDRDGLGRIEGVLSTAGCAVPDLSDLDDQRIDICADTDGDSCDDCSRPGGVNNSRFDPTNDGQDSDQDGLCNAGDPCVDTDGDGVGTGENGNRGCVTPDIDTHPGNPALCADTDLDACDDCSGQGVPRFNPDMDGLDRDGDGICVARDCNDAIGSCRELASSGCANSTCTPEKITLKVEEQRVCSADDPTAARLRILGLGLLNASERISCQVDETDILEFVDFEDQDTAPWQLGSTSRSRISNWPDNFLSPCGTGRSGANTRFVKFDAGDGERSIFLQRPLDVRGLSSLRVGLSLAASAADYGVDVVGCCGTSCSVKSLNVAARSCIDINAQNNAFLFDQNELRDCQDFTVYIEKAVGTPNSTELAVDNITLRGAATTTSPMNASGQSRRQYDLTLEACVDAQFPVTCSYTDAASNSISGSVTVDTMAP